MMCSVIKATLIFAGAIDRVVSTDGTSSTGLKWVLPFTEELISTWNEDEALSFDEKEYFEERRKLSNIEFKKEPPRAATQSFEVNYRILNIIEQWIRNV